MKSSKIHYTGVDWPFSALCCDSAPPAEPRPAFLTFIKSSRSTSNTAPSQARGTHNTELSWGDKLCSPWRQSLLPPGPRRNSKCRMRGKPWSGRTWDLHRGCDRHFCRESTSIAGTRHDEQLGCSRTGPSMAVTVSQPKLRFLVEGPQLCFQR